jgi:hypothetical protein
MLDYWEYQMIGYQTSGTSLYYVIVTGKLHCAIPQAGADKLVDRLVWSLPAALMPVRWDTLHWYWTTK